MKISFSRFVRLAPLFTLTLLLLPLAAFGQTVTRKENPTLATMVTSFQTSLGGNGWHYATATVHFENRSKAPLILGTDASKVAATDDKGNRYAVIATRGLGVAAGTSVDPKFVLPPGGGGDALYEMRWRSARNVEFGITFDLDVQVREVEALPSGQYRLGKEHLLGFRGLKSGYAAVPPGLPALAERTVNAGPFTAQITRTVLGITPNRRHQTVNLTVRFTNTSDKPLILAYESTSSYGTDNRGNRYGYGTAGTHDTSFSGIGLVTGAKADPQFVLAPGETREARFALVRPIGRTQYGTEMMYYVAIAQLEVLPSDQIRTVRQYSLTFPGLPANR